jgi:hypothetical protein
MLTMAQKINYAIGTTILVALIASGITTSCIQGRADRGKKEAIEVASELQGKVDVIVAQNQSKDKEIARHAQTIKELEQQVARGKADVARLRAGTRPVPAVPGDSVLPDGLDGPEGDGALVASLDAVIASQDILVAELKARDEIRAAREKATDEALALETKRAEAALKALKAMPSARPWNAALVYGIDEKGVTCYGVTGSRSFGSVSTHVVVIPGRFYGVGIGIHF